MAWAPRRPLPDQRQPAFGFRQGETLGRAPAPAPFARSHLKRDCREFSPLRRQRLRRDRRHAGERAAEHPEPRSRRVQFAARDASGLQLKARRNAAACIALLFALAAQAAAAGNVVDRIKSEGVIHCAGASRPGYLGQSAVANDPNGLYLDLCRAIGAAVLNPDGKIAFEQLDSDKAFASLRAGAADLAF